MNALTPEQKIAVDTLEGPLLVIAGAGSGKTRVVTFRIANLIANGVYPSQILGLTFTNKAAKEMKERIMHLTQHEVLISTFHSLGARILRESIHALGYRRDFTIYDEDDIDRLLKICIEGILETDKAGLKELKSMITEAKNSLIASDKIRMYDRKTAASAHFQAVYQKYQEKLLEYNALDFDDLLYLTVRLFREHPDILEMYQTRWPYLLIDEYQDTNAVQYAMVQMLVAKSRNICVVGDPDQAIYSWRGANVGNILNFEEDYPGTKVVSLNRNYRSKSNILEAANAVIARNSTRYDKKLWSDLGPGEKIKRCSSDTERSEATFIADKIQYHQQNGIPLSEMVVFYRTNAQSRSFEDRFIQRRIPYVIVGGISFYQRREIKDILAFLRMVHSGTDFISFERTINLPKRGLGDATIDKIRVGATNDHCSILLFCEKLIKGDTQSPIKLSKKQREGLQDYIRIIYQLQEISQKGELSDLVKAAIEYTHYKDYLAEDRETFEDRLNNVDALITKAIEWETSSSEPSLSAFLEELSLKSSLDEAAGSKEHVSLMTIHNGKGLEFTVTFMAGMEEGLFPHINTREDEKGVEEERRLCYVGMTRAKEFLYLTDCKMRTIWGITRSQQPSRFIREIPNGYIEIVGHSLGSSPTASLKYIPKPIPKDDNDFIDDMDQTVPDDLEGFENGDMVFHKHFGVGRIQNVYQNTAGITYKIFFTKDNSEKSIVAKYAPLTRLG